MPQVSDEKRGLKLHKLPIDKILDTTNPKTMEIRSSDTKVRGEILLLQTKDKPGEVTTATSGMVGVQLDL